MIRSLHISSRITGVCIFFLTSVIIGCKPRQSSDLKSSQGDSVQASSLNAAIEEPERYRRSKNYEFSISQNNGKDFTERQSVSGFEAFSHTPPGRKGSEEMPAIVFRLLSDLSGENGPFKDPVKSFEQYGFWKDPRFPERNLPIGFSFSYPDNSSSEPSYAIRTCASCHTSRIKLPGTENYIVLDGAGNHELRLHEYNYRLVNWTLEIAKDRKALREKLLSLVEQKEKISPNYFFSNLEIIDLTGKPRSLDAAFEAAEIKKFKKNVDTYIEDMVGSATNKKSSLDFLQKAYNRTPNANKAKIEMGPAGIADSGGLGLASMITGAKRILDSTPYVSPLRLSTPFRNLTKTFSEVSDPVELMFKGSTKQKVPSVWFQKRQEAAQWDGSVTNLLFRNLVAALGLLGEPENLDVAMSEIISEYIGNMPPPSFPAKVDKERAIKGKTHYDQYCAGCHLPNPQQSISMGEIGETPVFQIGTDSNRQKQVVGEASFKIARGLLLSVCQTSLGKLTASDSVVRRKTNIKIKIDGVTKTPCEFDESRFILPRITDASQGYTAKPLVGIWAAAPYLHNGSVPTLRHLLDETKSRPAKFYTGLISFDLENIGWEWNVNQKPNSPTSAFAVYDTSQDAFSNGGHTGAGRYIDFGNRVPKRYENETYKMSFGGSATDQLELSELLEYMKTL